MFKRQREKKTEQDRAPVHWFIPQNVLHILERPEIKAGAENSILVSHVSGKNPSLGLSVLPPRVYTGRKLGSRVRVRNQTYSLQCGMGAYLNSKPSASSVPSYLFLKTVLDI